MENASKALVIAGSILIAIAVISVSLYFYNNAREFAAYSNQVMSASQVQSFNRFYNSYRNNGNGGRIDAIDGLNILNHAAEDSIPCFGVNNLNSIYKNIGTVDKPIWDLSSESVYFTQVNFELAYDSYNNKIYKITFSS